ncbi:AlpA family transcriptional regulator [Caldichromatium japonicum]|uniref:AlpA family transcriptional regulator n=1 Tax=Caldichromatium japonicum TaxID=2699430 RepID=A0A6G7VDH3_9GAMM|nr:AlpA family transcriptional regulator [Caldichromatium japonicum]QIK38099.1 AlpA family transcriptional regulator [Caldichromatium japonicum]
METTFHGIDRILRLPDVMHVTGLRRTKIYDLINAGDFPPPLHLGPRAVGWKASDIQHWIDTRRLACEARWDAKSGKRFFDIKG